MTTLRESGTINPGPLGRLFASRPLLWTLGSLAAGAMLFAACGGDDDDADAPSDAETPTTQPTEEATPADDEASPDDSAEPTPADEPTSEDGESTDGDGDNGSAAASTDGCRARVTGDVETEWEVDDSAGYMYVGSDHWLSEDERRLALEESGYSDEEIEAALESGEPVLGVLLIDCLGEDASISLAPSSETTLNDIPFGEGTYPVAAGGTVPEAGEFTVILELGDPGLFSVADAGGELVISRWDTERIEGEFTFPIDESLGAGEPRTGEVHGTFSFGCQRSEICD